METIKIITGAIAANTVIFLILGFLARSIILHFLSKDIVQFKNQLEHKTNLEIESFRSKLEREHIRLQISYSGIFEKQANVILDLYKLIYNLEKKINSYMTPIEGQQKAYSEFIQTHKTLFDYYEKNKILLPKSFEDSFESFLRKIYNAINVHKNSEEQFKHREIMERLKILKQDDIDRLYSRQDKALEIIDNLPNFRGDLTEKLRTLMGINYE